MSKTEKELSRRQLLANAAFLGGSAVLASQLPLATSLMRKAEAGELGAGGEYPLAQAENVIYSVCLQCHNACAIKGKVLNGTLVKIDGNAYCPQNMLPHLDYASDPQSAVRVDGRLCPKGQAGIQTLYDPYRIRKVLKRSGPRGSNQWRTIPFDQAIQEIVEGGTLFADVKGEENRQVPGLKALWKVRDAATMKSLSDDSAKVAKGEMTLEAFKDAHAAHLDLLLDPDHPDLGPVNNQFVFLAGRIEEGRKEYAKRWLNGAFGSKNWFEHTTICEQSHHIAYQQVTNAYADGKWSGGSTHLKPDALHARFIIYFGTSPFEANFGPSNMTDKITEGIESGRLKIAVVDPRLSKTAAKAWRWLPIQPGTDAALALGMIRWMIDNKRYDAAYLANANKAAAAKARESSWTTATWLVRLENGQPVEILKAKDLPGATTADPTKRDLRPVAMVGGKPVAFNSGDDKEPVVGDLFVDTKIGETQVKSSFQLLAEHVGSRSVAEWAKDAGLTEADVAEVAGEFTSYGKQAGAEFYRGPVQHTNGYYNGQAIVLLNALIGSTGWKGGMGSGGSHWHDIGDKAGQPFNLNALHNGKIGTFGVPINREGVKYEATTLFGTEGYPAKRLWFPFTSNVYQEVIPSLAQGYPYSIKAMFLHMGTPVLAGPAGNPSIEALTDLEKLPLFFACDVTVAETSMYADYIFPDLSIWERWGFPHASPDVQSKATKIRQPIVGPVPETVKVYGEEMPISMEAIMLAIAEKMGLPGYGPDGFAPGLGFTRPEDWYLKRVVNTAWGDKEGEQVPAASAAEMDLFLKARQHLPAGMFDAQRWAKAAGDLWPQAVYVLNRGGRFESYAKAYKGDQLGHTFSGQFNIWVENVAKAKNPVSQQSFSGLPLFEPVRDAAGREIQDDGHDFKLITFKEVFGGQSRTPGNYWSLAQLPENFVLLNAADARRLGLKDGDMVRLTSATNPDGVWELRNGTRRPVAGRVRAIQGMRPGVVAASWHYGHWAYGAADIQVDGQTVTGDARRGTGICPNAVMRVDESVGVGCLSDPIGGSASFYDTRVKVVKA